MPEPSDPQLLAAYLAGSEEAFRALAARYASLIYAIAQRQAPPYLAEDITQAVFLLLARRAKTIRHPHLLAAWLLKVTHYCAADARRSAARREKHEHKAAAMAPTITTDPSPPEDDPLAASLHAALQSLSPTDRTAIILRYFRNETLAEIGTSLCISEEAAKKRVARAVEKLRKIFRRNKIQFSIALVAGTLARHASAASPALAAKIAGTALAKSATPTAALLIAKGASKLMAYTTAKLTAATAIAVLLIGAGALHIVLARHSAPAAHFVAAPTLAASPPGDPIIRATISKRLVPQDPIPIIEVRDLATNAPLAGVHVEIGIGQVNSAVNDGTTAPDGTVAVAYPASTSFSAEITAAAAGYVPIQTEWARTLPSDRAPARFVLRLEKAVAIGGQVVNFDGHPLAGATVKVRVNKHYDADTFVGDIPTTTTDSNGKWTLTAVPDHCLLAIGASHPLCLADYGNIATDPDIFNYPDLRPTLFTELRNRTHTLRLQRGIPVSGTVYGPDGKPRKASISVGLYTFNAATAAPDIQTADDGRFQFAARENTRLILTAHADGLAYAATAITLGTTPVQTDLTLTPRKPLVAHIVDSQGTPIANATVAIDHWDDAGSRFKPHTFPVALVSDSNGDITWNDAPAMTVDAVIVAPGCMLRRDVPLIPNTLNRITLVPRPLVHVHAIAAATGKPITDYWLQTSADSDCMRALPDGSYDLSEWRAGVQSIVVSATGEHYVPTDPPPLPLDGHNYDVTLSVSEGERLAGQLVDADGSPLPDTRVFLAGTNQQIFSPQFPFDPGAESLKQHPHDYATTDKDGNFSFSPQNRDYFLIVATEKGYVVTHRRKFERTGTLTLLPWATIHGTLVLRDGRAAGGIPIEAFMAAFQNRNPDVNYAAVTDERGQFTLPHIIAGTYQVISDLDSDFAAHVETKLKIRPGQTATITLHD